MHTRGALPFFFALGACDQAGLVDMAKVDAGPVRFEIPDLGGGGTDDMGDPNECFDWDPGCVTAPIGPPFPLQGDPQKDANERDEGLRRDPKGGLLLANTRSNFNYAWIANAQQGSVSKMDSRTVREIARYPTTTCYSLKTGSTAQCDGTKGCCSIDDWSRYEARKSKQQQPGHQAVQTASNSPSRTAIDYNGDLFISNRAFGGQSSVTRIANDPGDCIDRNHNGRIDTSSDTSGDGWIEIDCNGDGAPDDLAGVQQKPCNNGLVQEYYGQDDECVLWTSNTFAPGGIGRSIGLGPGDVNSSHSDAWAGSYTNGAFVRIDGKTGLDKDDTRVDNQPYGVAIDASGIAWSGPLGGPLLCYFDTKNPSDTGCARTPVGFSVSGYGITLDRDQNVWLGSGVMRYSPDRTNGFKNLGNGFWTKIQGANGIGIAADSRSQNDYFVWSCSNSFVLGIPASKIPMPGRNGQPAVDFFVQPNNWPIINMPCYGVGVDADQNIWGVDASTSTRAVIDNRGNVTQPKVNAQPKGNNKCPAGDSCPNAGAYTYSDFTGFGLRNFTLPRGTWSLVVPGCVDVQGQPLKTQWTGVYWEADTPPNTGVHVHARSGAGPPVDGSWGTWTPEATDSPIDLRASGLSPNLPDNEADAWLQIEVTLVTTDAKVTPTLKSLKTSYRCPL